LEQLHVNQLVFVVFGEMLAMGFQEFGLESVELVVHDDVFEGADDVVELLVFRA
jgi:hypothetical protein